MKFVFAAKKLTMTPAIHAYAERKIGKLDRYFEQEGESSVTFSVEKGRNCVEVTVRAGGLVLRAAEQTADMYATIDACVASIERQLRRHKTRLSKRLRAEALEWSAPEMGDFAGDEGESYEVTRVKRFPMAMMTVEEAILQMDLVGHDFFAFKNGDAHGAFSVVYRRKNGGYGLMEDAE